MNVKSMNVNMNMAIVDFHASAASPLAQNYTKDYSTGRLPFCSYLVLASSSFRDLLRPPTNPFTMTAGTANPAAHHAGTPMRNCLRVHNVDLNKKKYCQPAALCLQ